MSKKGKILNIGDQTKKEDEGPVVEKWSEGKICPFISNHQNSPSYCVGSSCALYTHMMTARPQLDEDSKPIKDDKGIIQINEIKIEGCCFTIGMQQSLEQNQFISYNGQMLTAVAQAAKMFMIASSEQSNIVVPGAPRAGR